jgi:hypothetical protein
MPPPVVACELYWAYRAGSAYTWTRAVAGYVDGEWHHCCPTCDGGITFAAQEDGGLEFRCHQGNCSEATVAGALLRPVAA